LPVTAAALDEPSDRTSRDAWAERSEVALIVEDEEGVRELASEFLSSAGYQVLTAKDGKEAAKLAKSHTEPIDVLLTDVVMPKMRGPELAKELRARYRNLRVIYMSGYLEYNAKNEELSDDYFLQKPFSRATLIEKVHEALRRVPVGARR
jgi:CheY-like chemotaxis protein